MDSTSRERDKARRITLDTLTVRYDLAVMLEEVRDDFTPEMGGQRLLKQSDISARFRKRRGPNRPAG